jgi:hypothetical protein
MQFVTVSDSFLKSLSCNDFGRAHLLLPKHCLVLGLFLLNVPVHSRVGPILYTGTKTV